MRTINLYVRYVNSDMSDDAFKLNYEVLNIETILSQLGFDRLGKDFRLKAVDQLRKLISQNNKIYLNRITKIYNYYHDREEYQLKGYVIFDFEYRNNNIHGRFNFIRNVESFKLDKHYQRYANLQKGICDQAEEFKLILKNVNNDNIKDEALKLEECIKSMKHYYGWFYKHQKNITMIPRKRAFRNNKRLSYKVKLCEFEYYSLLKENLLENINKHKELINEYSKSNLIEIKNKYNNIIEKLDAE